MANGPADFDVHIVDAMEMALTPESPSRMRDLTGRVLAGRYELKEIIGGGGMGTVYRALDVQNSHEVAVKVLDPRFDPARDPAYRERFLREARLSTRLSHGNIVEVVDTGESDEVHFIAMELLHGRTLAKLLETERMLPWERALKLTRQMGAGLAFAHELGLVHRDLKPANAFVVGEGENEWLKLLDFGLAKPVVNSAGDDEVTRTNLVMGSPTFMAPEQARGEATVTADIYALGVMLFRMLSGQVPFNGRTAIDVIVQHIQAPLPWLREVSPDANLPIEVELVMRRCLEKDPRARYPSVQALLAALDEAEAATRRDPSQRRATLQLALNTPSSPALPVVAGAPLEDGSERADSQLFSSFREPPSRSRGLLVPAVALLGLLALAFAAWRILKPGEAAPPAVAAAPAPAPRPVEAPPAPAPLPPSPVVAAASARAPATGPVTFRINSIPAGATVRVGNKVMGTTPTTFEEVVDESGEATAELTLELKGYQPITFIATSPGPRFDLVQRLQKAARRPAAAGGAAAAAAAAAPEEDPSLFIPVVMPSTSGGTATPVPTIRPAAAPTAVASAGLAAEPPAAPAEQQGVAVAVPPPRPGTVALEDLTSRPRLVAAGDPPRYNEQARVANAEGTAVARCTVTVQGLLEKCRLLKAVPLMEEALLASLKTRRYEPGRVGGEAVASEINVVMKVQSR